MILPSFRGTRYVWSTHSTCRRLTDSHRSATICPFAGNTGAYGATPSIRAEKHPAAMTVHFASTRPCSRISPFERSPSLQIAAAPLEAKIFAPLMRAASSTASVNARLSRDASSGRKIAASISSVRAGSNSRACSALKASARSPTPCCRAMMVLSSSWTFPARIASNAPSFRYPAFRPVSSSTRPMNSG